MGIHNRNKQHGFASVKPRDAEIVNKNRFNLFKKIAIFALILILSGTVFMFVRSDLDSKAKSAIVNLFNKEEKEVIGEGELDLDLDFTELDNPAVVVNPQINSNFVSNGQTQTVKLALLASPDLFDYRHNERLACDALAMINVEVPKTPRILNETLKLLFNDDFNYGFPPANFIASTQKDLNFESAVIENGISKIYLSGNMLISDESCDKNRIISQITKTSTQFPTVNSVEIYLNNQKIEL
jgi:hypothetical protein